MVTSTEPTASQTPGGVVGELWALIFISSLARQFLAGVNTLQIGAANQKSHVIAIKNVLGREKYLHLKCKITNQGHLSKHRCAWIFLQSQLELLTHLQ
jgi:hypothetical protein